MSLLTNMLFSLVITFLPKSKCLLISPSGVILEPQKLKSLIVFTVSPSIFHEVMGPDAMILVFWKLSFKLHTNFLGGCYNILIFLLVHQVIRSYSLKTMWKDNPQNGRRKAMANLDSILKSRDITLPTKAHLVKAMISPVVMYGCEGWTIKKAEGWRIDAF